MALSKKYDALLFRAKLKPILKHQTRNFVKQAKDIELVIIHDLVVNELKQRGILDE